MVSVTIAIHAADRLAKASSGAAARKIAAEIQDKLQPGWTRADGFPHERVAGDWVNVFDRLDPVCGFDPVLASDFRKGGQSKVEDIAVQNDGAWRHSITKYLRQKAFAGTLRRMLRV